MHPELTLPYFPVPIPTYGLLVVTGVGLGLLVSLWLGRRRGQSADVVVDSCLVAVVGAVLGARILGLLVEWRAVLASPLQALWYAGGLHFYGGFLGGALALVLWARRRGVPLLPLADTLAPGLLLGQVLGRLGCLCEGCCYGCPWPSAPDPLGLSYPRLPAHLSASDIQATGSIPYLAHVEQGLVAPGALASLPTVPVPLWESILCLILFFHFLNWALTRPVPENPPRPDGRLAMAVILSYAVVRFGLEFLRGDHLRGFLWGLSTSQWIALVILAVGSAYWYRNLRPKSMPDSH